MPLPFDVEITYSAIIDGILADSDLNTISAKRIRKGLQAQVSHDISDQKEDINALIHARFDVFNSKVNNVPVPTNGAAVSIPAPISNSAYYSATPDYSPKKRAGTDDPSELDSTSSPAPQLKKHKKTTSVEEDDAAFAARLQAEENLRSRARSTRGGGPKKKAPAKRAKDKTKKKKSSKNLGSDDESDAGSGSEEKKEVKRTGGFHKEMALSQPLSELLGETTLSRPQTVKKIWEYVKARDLQDPSDKRQIRCDDAMRAVFKQDRVHMFTMNKILNQNLYAVDE